jgi:hypothetical protein
MSEAQIAARDSRRLMGERILDRERQKLKVKENREEKRNRTMVEDGVSISSLPENAEGASATRKPSDDLSVSVFNRAGAVRTDLITKEMGGDADDEARLLFQLEMSSGATEAIRALKDEKDKADGFARFRDMKGVELARAAGISKNPDSPFSNLSLDPTGEESVIDVPKTIFTDPLHLPDDIGRVEEKEAFCATCFLPLIGDPRPDQLFIWLHAFRYSTTEFDWKSEEPYWSLDTYEVPRMFWTHNHEQV